MSGKTVTDSTHLLPSIARAPAWYGKLPGFGDFAGRCLSGAEAVELAKNFGGTDGYKYVNGVLDRIVGNIRPDEVRPG